MALDVLNVLGLLAVDVARDVEVEVVLLDLRDGTMREYFGSSSRLLKTSTILWMSCSRRRFLLPSFMKPALASIMKMPLRVWAFSLSSTMMQAGMPVP